tara:strand:- start:342 stop:605 length:264 start_codon:yes stop_codon:yes gene_type:complete
MNRICPKCESLLKKIKDEEYECNVCGLWVVDSMVRVTKNPDAITMEEDMEWSEAVKTIDKLVCLAVGLSKDQDTERLLKAWKRIQKG